MMISKADLAIITTIFSQHLPSAARVWCFGSRARGDARKFSDLDLVIDNAGNPLDLNTLSILKQNFSESLLAYKVDIVDWATLSTAFRENISPDKKLIFPKT